MQQLLISKLSTEEAFNILVDCDFNELESTRLAINWISHTVRPLTLPEPVIAVTLSMEASHKSEANEDSTVEIQVEKGYRDLKRVLRGILAPIVTVSNDQIVFAHHGLYEYLQTNTELLTPGFHEFITERCLAYLSSCSAHARTKDPTQEVGLSYQGTNADSSLLEYAALYWPNHYKLEKAPTAQLEQHVLDFVRFGSAQGPQNELRYQGDIATDRETPKKYREPDIWTETCSIALGWNEDIKRDPLLLASQLGLTRIVQHILEEDSMCPPERFEKALAISSQIGDMDTIHVLIQAVEPARLTSALCAAAESGHFEVLRGLLERMDDSDIRGSNAREGLHNPLLAAASQGHTSIVK